MRPLLCQWSSNSHSIYGIPTIDNTSACCAELLICQSLWLLLHVMREVGQVRVRQDFGRIHVPTLVLCGKKDTWNLKAAQELAHGVPGATLRTIPEAGHVWNLEMPDLFTHTIHEFVQQVEDTRKTHELRNEL